MTEVAKDVIERAAKAILRAEMSPHDSIDDEWICYDDAHKLHYRDLASAVITEAILADRENSAQQTQTSTTSVLEVVAPVAARMRSLEMTHVDDLIERLTVRRGEYHGTWLDTMEEAADMLTGMRRLEHLEQRIQALESRTVGLAQFGLPPVGAGTFVNAPPGHQVVRYVDDEASPSTPTAHVSAKIGE